MIVIPRQLRGSMKTLKNLPRLKLVDLLRRRKTTLARHLEEFGITTFEGLAVWCHRMGVLPPEEDVFLKAFPQTREVNNPQEGMIVLEPPPLPELIEQPEVEITRMDEPWSPVFEEETPQAPKRSRKKKVEPTVD